MKLIAKWKKDRKGRMASKCELGKVLIVRITNRIYRKPYRIYVAGCSKGSFMTLFEALDKINKLEK